MLGTDLNGNPYDYDGPYFPQYRPAQTRELHINGRRWVKRTELSPLTRYDRATGKLVTVQGFHTATWTFSNEGNFAAVRHTSREVNAPRHPQR